MSRLTRPSSIWGLTLAFYAAVLLFSFLDFALVYQVSEGREGVVVNEILASNEWILPLRNGEIVPSKPILFHWMGALSAKLFGRYDEFVLRFPSAVAGLGMVLVLFGTVAHLSSPATGFLAGMILLGTYGFFHMTQDGRVDMVFSFFAVSAICLWIVRAHDAYLNGGSPRTISMRTYLGVSLLMGLAALAKGPLGIVLPGGVIVCCAVVFFRKQWWRVLFQPAWALALFVPLPWYIMAAKQGSDAFLGRVFFENVTRFSGAENIREKPFWYYIPQFAEQAFPWSVFFLLYLFFLARGARDVRRGRSSSNPFVPKRESSAFGIYAGLIWFGVMFVLFSLSAGKRSAYLLPLLPAMSLVLSLRFASTWERWQEQRSSGMTHAILSRGVFRAGVVVWLLLIGSGLSLWVVKGAQFPALEQYPGVSVSIQSLERVFARSGGRIELFFLVFAVFSIVAWFRAFRQREALIAGCVALILCHFFLTVHMSVIAGLQGATHTYKGFAYELRDKYPEERINFMKVLLDESFDGFFFYFGRHVTQINPAQIPSKPGLYLARREWLTANLPQIPLHALELETGGRLIDPPEKDLVLFRLVQ